MAGLLLGVLLGPAVIGRLAPDLYNAMFSAGEDPQVMLDDFDQQTERQMSNLKDAPDAELAVTQLLIDRQEMRIQLLAGIEAMHDQQAMRLIWALLAAMALVLVLEAMLSPQNDESGRSVVRPVYRRLISVRYALLALIVAVTLSRPGLLGQVSLSACLLIAAVALITGLIPLGLKKPPTSPPSAA
ncbi:MAG: hypothetical protein IT445_12015 [Phycisphaeraceae bacterium]|nr:hypothetical protein [Phycisphaeraceae bacterium]